jgi:osmotically-inducible protein OsmY
MKKSDPEIHQEVLHELDWDTHVLETEIGVTVDRGIVTLSGQVGSWAKREAAQEAAHRVAGVLDVANDIEVHLPGSGPRSDADIARAVRDSLEWDVFVPDSRIRSTVSQGQVTLEGDVDFGNQRSDAERAIRNLLGVTRVINRIEVAPPKVAAAELRSAIEAALRRQSQREAQRVNLDLEDGLVTVTGVVHSNSERQAVVGAVKGTPGVTHVDSRLRIEPYQG